MIAGALPVLLSAQSLETAARKYRSQPVAGNRTAMIRAANPQGLGKLALAAADLDAKRFAAALDGFRAARTEVPVLADHANYGAARALIGLGRKTEAIPFFLAVAESKGPPSPHLPQSVLDGAELLLQQGSAEQAAALLNGHLDGLPAGKAHYFYATALEGTRNYRTAAIEYQQSFFQDPIGAYSDRAKAALDRLKTALGPDYPPELPSAWLNRADTLIKRGRGKQAAAELTALLPQLVETDRQQAAVRIGAALFRARDYPGALAHMAKLGASGGEAGAERLYYMAASARRLKRSSDHLAALRALAEKHPNSPWRLEALLDNVNQFLISNQPGEYEPIYEVCFTTFRGRPEAGACHWKVAWSHYVRRFGDARELLARQVEWFPQHDDTPAALYFLGRMQEVDRDLGKARAYFEAVWHHFPNYYYGVTARERLEAPSLSTVATDAALRDALKRTGLPAPGAGADFTEDDQTRRRLARARMLSSAAIDDWATQELLYGGAHGANRNLIGVELAKLETQRGNYAQGLRYVKGHANGYLSWRLEDAPVEFWKQAFPLPFRDNLEKHAATQNLDPLIVAGLMRQESEFDPNVVSYAKAVGLTQIMPATGRELSRRLGYKSFRTSMLTQPDFNLRLGTYYLRRVLDSFDGMWVAALAGYNAGPSRANTWLRWADFREPSEFIETIPFHQTRHYVQSVLRNADIYRRLYSGAAARVPSSIGARNNNRNPAIP